MDAAEIREPPRPRLTPDAAPEVVTVLPPREGFSPQAVGAIGLLVHRLGQPLDVVVGQATTAPTFPGRRFVPVAPPFRPWLGRADRYALGVLRCVRRLRPRVVEVHNRATLALRLVRALPHSRVVLFLHNDPQAMRQAHTPRERTALLRHVTVVCVSHHLARRFVAGVDAAAGSPLVLPNAIELSALPPCVPADARAKEILFVGRVVADKGADAFVTACEIALPLLPGWQAAIIGADRFWPSSAPTAFERRLLPRAEAAGIALRGYLPHADVLRAMARASIVVVPSRWDEPFGMVALEAAACGAALVCSMRGGLAEVVGDAALPADPDALADAVVRLARDDGLRARLSAAGLARARQFDAPEARRRLQELRARLLTT